MSDLAKHERMANAIRALAMDAVEKAKSGHPGMPMGMADVATVLFTRYLKFDPTDPRWPDRDRFVLSAGHGSMLLYSVLYLLGVEDMTIDEIKRFRQLGSKTPGHPENVHDARRRDHHRPARPGARPTPSAWRLPSASWRRSSATTRRSPHLRHRLRRRPDGRHQPRGDLDRRPSAPQQADRLLRRQRISIDGPLSLAESGDQVARFEAAGWNAARIDGHNPDEIAAAIEAAQKSDQPSMIACKTTIGFGAPTKAGTAASHGIAARAPRRSPAPARRSAGIRRPSRSPPMSATPGASPGSSRAQPARSGRSASPPPTATRAPSSSGASRGDLPRRLRRRRSPTTRSTLAADKPKVATRKASEMALDVINAVVPETIGGSADLTRRTTPAPRT